MRDPTPRLHDVLVRELPHLRRQAFAFAGSRQAGDEAVARCLSAIAARPEQLDPARPRRDIYRVFCRVARQEAAWRDQLHAVEGEGARLWRGLGELPPTERHAFLLEALQQFPPADIAHILGLESGTAIGLLHRARATVARARLPGVLIVGDDRPLARDMESAVIGTGLRVCGTARSAQEAVSIARATQPDLILADVNLATGGDRITACEQICRSRPISVIYITGFPEGIKGGRRRLVVPKPCRMRSLSRALSRALSPAMRETLAAPAGGAPPRPSP